MTDLFREAEDELRKEAAESVVKRALPWFIGALVVAVGAAAGWHFWQQNEERRLQDAAVAYAGALEKLQANDLEGGAKALEALMSDAPDGMRAQAALQRASILQEQNKTADARAAFDAAAASIRDPDLADLARIRAAWIAADSETLAQLQARLKPVIDRKGAFASLAREIVAAAQWAAGDGKAARIEYALLEVDPNAPPGVRQRATQALAVIDAAAKPSDTPLQLPEGPDGPSGGAPAQAPAAAGRGG